ncbi:hypothetical protein PybrP1_004550 [[Pythium] brassicae (nom. inval.)]|nr:hypothetical protein PybrP1_004550 [[Pythium] brassicae (nom. inval.)]
MSLLDDPHALVSASDSEADSASLCGSELELEMAWGEGPIAPLRAGAMASTATPAAASTSASAAGAPATAPSGPTPASPAVRSKSVGNGSSRARTPQKRATTPELSTARAKRTININPIRSAAYLMRPNELPVGVRKQQRWFNDHHFGNRAATTRLEDLMEHMSISVEWKYAALALDAPCVAASGKGASAELPKEPRVRRHDDWNEAEDMFLRIDRRARTLLVRSFQSFAAFIEAAEYVVLHFIQIEVASGLLRVLAKPMELLQAGEKDVRLVIPLVDSAFHRLIVHSVCQFYGIVSRTEANRRFNTKIMVLKTPRRKFTQEQLGKNSLCEFIRETRFPAPAAAAAAAGAGAFAPHFLRPEADAQLEVQSVSSECSDGFTLMEYPRV